MEIQHFDRKTLRVSLVGKGQFTKHGNTEFTFKGVYQHEGRDRSIIIAVHSYYVDSRHDLIELSLLPTGQPVTFDVGGSMHPNGIFEVNAWHGVNWR